MPTVSHYSDLYPAFLYSTSDSDSALLDTLRDMVAEINPDEDPNSVTSVTKDGAGVMSVSFGALSFTANPGDYVLYNGSRFVTRTPAYFAARYTPADQSFSANVQLDVSGTAVIERT